MANTHKPDAPEMPPAKRARRDYNDTMSVLVGAEEEKFTMHTAVACAKSQFLKAAWFKHRTAEHCVVRIPEHGPRTFEVFIHWSYTNEIDLLSMDEPAGGSPPSYLNCAKVWVLGDDLGSRELQNRMIDRVLAKLPVSEFGVPDSTLEYIWSVTHPGSALRRLMVDASVKRRRHDLKDVGNLPPEIVKAALQRYFEGKPRSDPIPTLKNRCDYHEHPEGDPRCTRLKGAEQPSQSP